MKDYRTRDLAHGLLSDIALSGNCQQKFVYCNNPLFVSMAADTTKQSKETIFGENSFF